MYIWMSHILLLLFNTFLFILTRYHSNSLTSFFCLGCGDWFFLSSISMIIPIYTCIMLLEWLFNDEWRFSVYEGFCCVIFFVFFTTVLCITLMGRNHCVKQQVVGYITEALLCKCSCSYNVVLVYSVSKRNPWKIWHNQTCMFWNCQA